MKNTLLFLLISCSILSYGQKIRFTDTSNKWMTRYVEWGSPTDPMSVYIDYTRFTGDTIWNGVHYLKLGGIISTEEWEFLVREDTMTNKVYYRVIKANTSPVDTNEYVGYDFGLKVGDTVVKRGTNFQTGIATAVYVDSVLIQNSYHKVWYFSYVVGQLGHHSFVTIEGIGDMYGPTYGLITGDQMYAIELQCFTTHNITPQVAPPVSNYFDNVSSCILDVNDLKLAQHPITFYPNPSDNGVFHTNSGKLFAKATIEVYNSYGVMVKQTILEDVVSLNGLPKGVYYYRVTLDNVNQPFTGYIIY